jgi:antitoxin CptB
MSGDVARLRWRCRRGMRELDVLLIQFLERSYASLSQDDKARFQRLLELPDPDLHAYLVAQHGSGDDKLDMLVGRIRSSLHP